MQSNQHFNPSNPAAAYGYGSNPAGEANAQCRQQTDRGAILGVAGAVGYASDECTKERVQPTVTAFVEVRADRCFADALMHAMDGQRITRRGWNAPNQYVSAQYPDKGSKMSAPYLFLKNAQNEMVPWVPSQGDLFAHDWAMLPRS